MRKENLMHTAEFLQYADHIEEHEDFCLRARGLARLKMENLTIILGGGYEVDLERITSNTSLYELLYHLREKEWFIPQMMADFLRQFEKAFCENFETCHRGNTSRYWNWADKTFEGGKV